MQAGSLWARNREPMWAKPAGVATRPRGVRSIRPQSKRNGS